MRASRRQEGHPCAAQIHVDVKLFMIGGMVLDRIVLDVKNSYAKSQALTNLVGQGERVLGGVRVSLVARPVNLLEHAAQLLQPVDDPKTYRRLPANKSSASAATASTRLSASGFGIPPPERRPPQVERRDAERKTRRVSSFLPRGCGRTRTASSRVIGFLHGLDYSRKKFRLDETPRPSQRVSEREEALLEDTARPSSFVTADGRSPCQRDGRRGRNCRPPLPERRA